MQISLRSLSIVIGLLLATPAQAASQRDFFDWDYAVTIWTTMTTLDQGLAEWNAVMPAYEKWKKSYERNPKAALEALEDHPQKDLIQRGHDLALVYEVWGSMYDGWRHGRFGKKATPFNQNTNLITCMSLKTQNIFTGKCNDMPDWRTDNNRAEDLEVLERARALRENGMQ